MQNNNIVGMHSTKCEGHYKKITVFEMKNNSANKLNE